MTTVAMTVDGFVLTPTTGTVSLGFPEGQTVRGSIGDQPIDSRSAAATVPRGRHRIHIETTLTGDIWRFDPRWNGSSVFDSILTTTAEPGRMDGAFGRVAGMATAALAIALLAWWLVAACRIEPLPVHVVVWMIASGIFCATSGVLFGRTAGTRVAALLLAAAIFVRVPYRLRNIRGAVLLIGVPWLALFAGASTWDIGQFSFYTPGDDFWAFQVFAHRIYMQGYWLEGGQQTFWFQPLYRWVVGLVHIVFGDSSVGETYLDAASLLIGAMFAFAIVIETGSFAWALAAAFLTLATVVIGPSWWLIGRGLSEILAAGVIAAAALIIMRDRTASVTSQMTVAVLAVASVYLRLNNLLVIAALPVLLLPCQLPAAAIWTPKRWLPWVRVTTLAIVWGALAGGLVLFAWRTWYYTGVFSVFFGTQRDLLATIRPTDTPFMAAAHIVQSLFVLITVQDPPRFDPRSALVMTGVAVSLLALLRVRWCQDVPASAAVLCVAGLSGAVVARGSAYVGRFSIHLIPVAVAVAVWFNAIVWRRIIVSYSRA